MTILAMTAIIFGALLGLRFKVLVLIPAIAIGTVATFGIGMVHSNSLWSVVLAMVLFVSALQMGYLGGAARRFANRKTQVNKDSFAIIETVQRPAR